MSDKCCFIGCKKLADFEVYSKSGDTLACSGHLVELLCDDEEHTICRVPEFLDEEDAETVVEDE